MARSRFSLWIAALLVVAVLAIGWVWSGYNSLVRARAALDASWAQVETQYQRRFDLVPNLQATVQGAADFEQETFVAVTQARSQWQQADNRSEEIAAINQFESALSRLLVTVESYPQLQATQAFRDFMTQLEGTENRIAVARRDYNEEVRSYNVSVRTFPRNILAGLFGYEASSFFEGAEGTDVAPQVDFE